MKYRLYFVKSLQIIKVHNNQKARLELASLIYSILKKIPGKVYEGFFFLVL